MLIYPFLILSIYPEKECEDGASGHLTKESALIFDLSNINITGNMACMKQNIKTLYFAYVCLLLLSGCASVLLAGASGGVAYSITNIAYKTIPYPIDQVDFANRLALMKMGIKYVDVIKTENRARIFAETYELKIYIDLDKITPKSTKISVDAKKNFLLKDKSTAEAIIDGTEAMLSKD